MTMLPVITFHVVQLHCREVQREVAQERLTASLALAPRWILAPRLRQLRGSQRWSFPRQRSIAFDAPQLVKWIVARP